MPDDEERTKEGTKEGEREQEMDSSATLVIKDEGERSEKMSEGEGEKNWDYYFH